MMSCTTTVLAHRLHLLASRYIHDCCLCTQQFDIPACAVMFDGKHVYATDRGCEVRLHNAIATTIATHASHL
jgi:hypothetical protein